MTNRDPNVKLTGLHIQWPWSRYLIEGKKLVETRSYPIPEKHVGEWLALIETPGKAGRRRKPPIRTRIIGLIRFSGAFRYNTKQSWKLDFPRHLVKSTDLEFGFSASKPKWGWTVGSVHKFQETFDVPCKRGIIFAKGCEIPSIVDWLNLTGK